jgi:peptidoglycan-associated lipoprotein
VTSRPVRSTAALACTLVVLAAVLADGCAKKPPVARPTPPPPDMTMIGEPPPPPPPPSVPGGERVPDVTSPDRLTPDVDLGSRSLDELNRDSPLQPVFFELDSSEVSGAGQATLTANADVLQRYPTWAVTIEGHCDERGTAEYNLALGERRALAVRAYLVTLGIAPDRLRTVSYGKEFPFDPGRTEDAYAKNRRAHFVITAR